MVSGSNYLIEKMHAWLNIIMVRGLVSAYPTEVVPTNKQKWVLLLGTAPTRGKLQKDIDMAALRNFREDSMATGELFPSVGYILRYLV